MPLSFSPVQSARHLNQGGLLAYPTEAVWGLGCNPFDEEAVARLLQLKSRDVNKGFILLFPSLSSLKPYLLNPSDVKKIVLNAERPTTYLVAVNQNIPATIKGQYSRLAVRICQHPQVQEILQHIPYPLVSTSLNPQGLQAATQGFQVRRYFPKAIQQKILAISQGSVGNAITPSQIINLDTNQILRH